MQEYDSIQLARTFAQISAALLSRPSVQNTLQEIVDLAADTVYGAATAGITLVHRDGTVESPAYTDESVLAVDQVQIEFGEGPCLQASREDSVLRIDDMRAERRWPRFAARAAELGVGSMIACSLAAPYGDRAALNLHASRPAVFAPDAADLASVYAAHCSVALGQASLVDSLRSAMISRQAIGEATGILMERHRVGSQRAFELLVQASQRLNVKLRVVAEQVVLTGQDPPRIQPGDLPPVGRERQSPRGGGRQIP